MRFQHARRLLSGRPPLKTALRQTFLCEPKSLAVIDQNADRRSAPAAEHKHATGKWVRLKLLFAQPRQRIDSLSSVHGFDRDQNLHLRRDLDHICSMIIRLSWARSDAVIPFH